MTRSSVTPTPHQLRALTHPVRLRMLGILRLDGPATATTLAERLRLNTGATSYHLRQLAQHGFVVDDEERGTGRERWWKAAHSSTHTTSPPPDDLEAADTMDAYLQVVATIYTEQLQRAMEERPLHTRALAGGLHVQRLEHLAHAGAGQGRGREDLGGDRGGRRRG